MEQNIFTMFTMLIINIEGLAILAVIFYVKWNSEFEVQLPISSVFVSCAVITVLSRKPPPDDNFD